MASTVSHEATASQPEMALETNPIKQVTYDAVVVGGGLAGLHATRALIEDGRAVMLVESRDQAGGRTVRTRRDHGSVPLGELGAMFVHDLSTKEELEKNGAKVIDFPSHAYFIAKDGVLTNVGESNSPLNKGGELIAEAKLQATNMSMAEFLSRSKIFQEQFTADERQMVAALFEADLGGELDKVGIACLLYDKQTLGGGTDMFGYCISGGFSNLTRAIVEAIPEEARMLGTDAKNIVVKNDGTISLQVALPPDGPIGEQRPDHLQAHRPDSELITNGLVLAIPPTALRELSIRYESPEQVDLVDCGHPSATRAFDSAARRGQALNLLDRVTPDVYRAINMMEGGNVVKVAVRLRGTIVPGEPFSHVTVADSDDGKVPCASVWGLSVPHYGDSTLVTDEQTVVMYMGGGQALRFAEFLKSVSGDKEQINAAVRMYLKENLGIEESRVLGDAQISQWIASTGRIAYTYLLADDKPLEFNPREVFSKPIVPDANIYVSGEAYDPIGGSMTTGAWHSGRTAASLV